MNQSAYLTLLVQKKQLKVVVYPYTKEEIEKKCLEMTGDDIRKNIIKKTSSYAISESLINFYKKVKHNQLTEKISENMHKYYEDSLSSNYDFDSSSTLLKDIISQLNRLHPLFTYISVKALFDSFSNYFLHELDWQCRKSETEIRNKCRDELLNQNNNTAPSSRTKKDSFSKEFNALYNKKHDMWKHMQLNESETDDIIDIPKVVQRLFSPFEKYISSSELSQAINVIEAAANEETGSKSRIKRYSCPKFNIFPELELAKLYVSYFMDYVMCINPSVELKVSFDKLYYQFVYLFDSGINHSLSNCVFYSGIETTSFIVNLEHSSFKDENQNTYGKNMLLTDKTDERLNIESIIDELDNYMDDTCIDNLRDFDFHKLPKFDLSDCQLVELSSIDQVLLLEIHNLYENHTRFICCKYCGDPFIPTSSANTICSTCKAKKIYTPQKRYQKKITDNPVTRHKKKITDRFSQQKSRAKDTEKNIIENKKQLWIKKITPYLQKYENGQLSSDDCIKIMENEYITLIKKQANKE